MPDKSNLPDEARTWALWIGLFLSVGTLWKLLWSPVMSGIRAIHERVVLGVLDRRSEDVARLMRERVLHDEVRLLRETATMTEANKDRLQAVQSAIEAQGSAMKEMGRALDQLKPMPETLREIERNQRQIGEDLHFIRGRFAERDNEPWDGDERRKQPR